jgi:hypothetical protein
MLTRREVSSLKEVVVVKSSPKALKEKIQVLKDEGKRILATHPHKWKTVKGVSTATEIWVVAQ